jgi:HlyD family secretion protein
MKKARSSLHFTFGTNGKSVLVVLALVAVGAALAPLTAALRAEEAARAVPRTEPPGERNWQAVAPGRIEPVSGEIKIAAPVAGIIGAVLVQAGDKVTAGEPLIRLADREAQARIATAEAQIALRKRARNDQAPSSKAGDRRKAEDAVADGEKAVIEARAAFDRTASERRAGRASDADVEAARAALVRVKDSVKELRADLRKLEQDSATPLPSQTEGQLNIARTELWAAEAAAEKLTVRAPISATVLQVNAKLGEVAMPSATQPLLVLGDISALRVRAELDERDFGEIKVGQAVSVRPDAFRGREFAGKVAFIAPLVEPSRSSRGQRNQTDVDVVEVLVDLAEPGPLAVGMKADVYFRHDAAQH